MYPYFSIFGKQISTYSILALLGLAVAMTYTLLTNKKGRAGHVATDDIWNIFACALIGIFVGGKALGVLVDIPLVIEYWPRISGDWVNILLVLFSSFVFYGGLFGCMASTYIYCKRYNVSFSGVFGLMVPAIPLFHSFARIGCFMAGCCWGIECRHGVIFTHSPVAPAGIPLLPVQLIESATNLLLFFVLAYISRRIRNRMNMLPLYLTLYGVARFIIEFFRGDSYRGIFFGVSTSQWISLALILISALYWIKKFRNRTVPSSG